MATEQTITFENGKAIITTTTNVDTYEVSIPELESQLANAIQDREYKYTQMNDRVKEIQAKLDIANEAKANAPVEEIIEEIVEPETPIEE